MGASKATGGVSALQAARRPRAAASWRAKLCRAPGTRPSSSPSVTSMETPPPPTPGPSARPNGRGGSTCQGEAGTPKLAGTRWRILKAEKLCCCWCAGEWTCACKRRRTAWRVQKTATDGAEEAGRWATQRSLTGPAIFLAPSNHRNRPLSKGRSITATKSSPPRRTRVQGDAEKPKTGWPSASSRPCSSNGHVSLPQAATSVGQVSKRELPIQRVLWSSRSSGTGTCDGTGSAQSTVAVHSSSTRAGQRKAPERSTSTKAERSTGRPSAAGSKRARMATW
mmetsp:Transcript_13968/g.49151  ORF Transcript_13968/g.49151 Transcript_13968/m.49151 type:complete len:281 (-) Transcript_13968:683-1525(-)